MLNTNKNIELTGYSVIDGVNAEFYRAVINSTDPNNIEFGSTQLDKALCKASRTQCRADEAEFEDMAYAIQDEMLAELATKELATE